MKLAPTHLKRYKDVALLFIKYANSDVLAQSGFGEATEKDRKEADQLTSDLEKLGPTFIKIGQLLSTRGDLLPPVYLDALSRLQDDVEPVPFEKVEETVQEQLGVRISKAFADFDSKPLGAASLGQVHLATLHSGRRVAVKVQRPDIRKEIVADLDSLGEIAAFLEARTEFGRRYEIARILDQFRGSILRELDYLKEASHLAELRQNLAGFEHLHVPEVIDDFSTSQVLTMEYLPGTKITSLSGAVLADLDGAALAEELFQAYLQQILVDGFFHADPHPGNLLLTPERHLAILDLGMIGRVNQQLRDQLLHLLAGIAEGDGVQTAEAAMRIGEPRDREIDRKLFVNAIESIVGESRGRSIANLQVGAVVLLVMQACADAGLRIPGELHLLGKTLMNLDRVGIALAPDFDPNESIRRHLNRITTSRVKDSFNMANVMGVLSEVKEFVSHLPQRLNRIAELVADNKLRVKVDSIDEHKLIQGLQKVANRITLGLILAALIVASSMLARVDTAFKLFGYPGFAMILLFLAATGALGLVVQIFFKDE